MEMLSIFCIFRRLIVKHPSKNAAQLLITCLITSKKSMRNYGGTRLLKKKKLTFSKCGLILVSRLSLLLKHQHYTD